MGVYEDLEKNRDKAPRNGFTEEDVQELKDIMQLNVVPWLKKINYWRSNYGNRRNYFRKR